MGFSSRLMGTFPLLILLGFHWISWLVGSRHSHPEQSSCLVLIRNIQFSQQSEYGTFWRGSDDFDQPIAQCRRTDVLAMAVSAELSTTSVSKTCWRRRSPLAYSLVNVPKTFP